MAENMMMKVPENFDMEVLEKKLVEVYSMKGFAVNSMNMTESLRVVFDKNCGGINMLFGLGKGITVNIMRQNDMLMVNYSEGDWIGKGIGLGVGWILCFIPFITAIVGSIEQLGLPKEINNDIMMILASMK